LKIPTHLQLDIAESHAAANVRKKIKELCSCPDCKYVQAFYMKQIRAQIESQCGSCGEPCEEEEE